ncbi:YggS family pyridoxal phosphate-dependent enzyme [Fredinandcohnia quinoae]|uniref:Pyridoxal phosphate homeostasis protein n=1 Tax=Fredinandcohnia quinoae TaxID=2918902 RepID=A0AAW5E3C9_9BACI|nr:YggS family pyridoxal phosphate-dependent enzyme [Fredinandcohnia sp. SECRCQ15]MCH1623861.1 YggS family pyridoxal phosphate-dependent enzyme [Fredinandcohnia sp. SECRCQ15]
MTVRQNLEEINKRISEVCVRSGRIVENISIIAVTKYVSIERTKEAIEVGITNIGENRDEGFLKKWEEIGSSPKWHFIGSLQSRKVKNIIDKVDFIHSLDRVSLAEEIDKRATKKIKCFIQVNASGEQSKHGIEPEQLFEFIEQMKNFSSIEIVGLMTMAPFTEDENVIRECFRKLKQLRDDIHSHGFPHAPCTELSMGMSNDFEIAIEEGATFIRLGTSLVGNER